MILNKIPTLEELPRFIESLIKVSSQNYLSGFFWTGNSMQRTAIKSFLRNASASNSFSIFQLMGAIQACKNEVAYSNSLNHLDVEEVCNQAVLELMNKTRPVLSRAEDDRIFAIALFDYYAQKRGSDMIAAVHLMHLIDCNAPCLTDCLVKDDLLAIVDSENYLLPETKAWIKACLKR